MTDAELLAQADNLQKEAQAVLGRLQLFEYIKEVGEPELVGSASYNLMIDRDIDIHVSVPSMTLEKVAAILPVFARMPSMQKVQFNNYRELRRDHRADRVRFPHAYYMGLRSVEPDGEWKIDIWFGEPGTVGDYDPAPLAHITDEERLAILRIKKELKGEKHYRDGILSIDIYKAVLAGARDCGEFIRMFAA